MSLPFVRAQLELHYPRLLLIAKRRTRRWGWMYPPQDLVHAAAIRMLLCAGQFEDGTNFLAWAATIINSTFMSFLRKKKEFLVKHGGTKSEERDFDEYFERSEDADQEAWILLTEVMPIFLQFAPAYFQSLLLTMLTDITFEELATLHSIPIGSVKSRLFRMRNYLSSGGETRNLELHPEARAGNLALLNASVRNPKLLQGRVDAHRVQHAKLAA